MRMARLQRRHAGGELGARDGNASLAPPLVHEVVRSQGKPMGAAVRAQMETRFGTDFSRVRVHDDSDAARSAYDVGAQAYAVGSDIVFSTGTYRPATVQGNALLAHELAHVVQQQHAQSSAPLRMIDGHDASGGARTSLIAHRVVARQPNSDPHIGPGMPQSPAPLGGFTIRLELDSNMAPTGKASISVAGPSAAPLIGGAEIGLQHNADGTWTAVTGKGKTFVTPEDVRKILRGSTNIDPSRPKDIRLPSCTDLRRPGGGAFYSVSEFKSHAFFNINPVTAMYWSQLPDWFVSDLISRCKPAPLPMPDKGLTPDYNDLPAPSGESAVA